MRYPLLRLGAGVKMGGVGVGVDVCVAVDVEVCVAVDVLVGEGVEV